MSTRNFQRIAKTFQAPPVLDTEAIRFATPQRLQPADSRHEGHGVYFSCHAIQGLKTLPNKLFSCSERRIEEQVRYLRQVESVNADMPAIEFWTTVDKFKDPSGANPMQDISAPAMNLLVLPL
ncbi:hypothetical protein HPB48_004781 [Haemaphysalis longicornis]|uniref:Uncharacterized protein n=1 Tax=Haemaphysalis longicornis TaxID=44386 RepID=A0A9J6FE41_HAELO|nr:hypothetical protein HPB48_004781 [Haemaphysalis longicornis]